MDLKSRKDHFYCWNHVGKNYSIRSDIVSNTLSDHHIISLSLVNITTKKRGSSYWKLNTSVLQNKEYKQKIETFWLHWKNKKNIYPDQTKWWDMAELYIQEISKDVSVDLKQKETEVQ